VLGCAASSGKGTDPARYARDQVGTEVRARMDYAKGLHEVGDGVFAHLVGDGASLLVVVELFRRMAELEQETAA
jgi:hypothetical protein